MREEVIKDQVLIKLHLTRLGEQEYLDASFTILTQDVIYTSGRYYGSNRQERKSHKIYSHLSQVQWNGKARLVIPILKGFIKNYTESKIEHKKIGDLGELLVLLYESEKLRTLGISKEPVQKSKSEGDGLGYDILSYDDKGKEIFIEVKTTTKGPETPFFITEHELQQSKIMGINFSFIDYLRSMLLIIQENFFNEKVISMTFVLTRFYTK